MSVLQGSSQSVETKQMMVRPASLPLTPPARKGQPIGDDSCNLPAPGVVREERGQTIHASVT